VAAVVRGKCFAHGESVLGMVLILIYIAGGVTAMNVRHRFIRGDHRPHGMACMFAKASRARARLCLPESRPSALRHAFASVGIVNLCGKPAQWQTFSGSWVYRGRRVCLGQAWRSNLPRVMSPAR